MRRWTVEIDDELLDEIGRWPKDRRRELAAVQGRLARGGPEAMGLVKSELEGLPAWGDLATPYCLPLAVYLPSGGKILALEIQPDFRVIIVGLE